MLLHSSLLMMMENPLQVHNFVCLCFLHHLLSQLIDQKNCSFYPEKGPVFLLEIFRATRLLFDFCL